LFDVYASTQSQKYLGYQYRDKSGRRLAGESADSRRKVAETTGHVCTWEGRLFCPYYSAVCGGRTTEGCLVFSDAAPPLQSVECHWCREAQRYRWSVDLPKDQVDRKLRAHFASTGQPFDGLASIRPAPTTASASSRPLKNGTGSEHLDANPVKNMRFEVPVQLFQHGANAEPPVAWEVSDGRRQYRLTGRELSQALAGLGMPSDRFTVETAGETIVIRGRGHGHGVGLCQWGARGLALAGLSSAEIIGYYYPGAQVVILEP
jgi:stage II sporulation protein D